MDDLFADRAIRNQQLDRRAIERLVGVPQKLVDCDLEASDLARVDLSDWTFERCNFRKVDLTGATLERTGWQSCRGAFANFTGGDLTEARLIACDFNNASFKRICLEGARIERCKLTGADLSDARALHVHFEETLLVNAKVHARFFHKTTLRRMDFAQANLSKCDFRDATFEECSLRETILDQARFDGADLRGADIGGVRLQDASRFRGAIISRDQAAQFLSELGLRII